MNTLLIEYLININMEAKLQIIANTALRAKWSDPR